MNVEIHKPRFRKDCDNRKLAAIYLFWDTGMGHVIYGRSARHAKQKLRRYQAKHPHLFE